MINDNNLVFALDIGTRKVIGLIGKAVGEQMEIIAVAKEEHQTRAMLDGQVHDIERVAHVVMKVKKKLENVLGRELPPASIAAAGRALKTIHAQIKKETNPLEEIKAEDVTALEFEAVQAALSCLQKEQTETDDQLNYHCVGYSVVHYFLENEMIMSLVGHRGKSIAVEVLATFLPRVVVDSLLTVLQRAGLTMASLTLEPIAAANVVIPPDMRRLNLALVDVGAGTSDIAITKDGSVIGYGMVPLAGDEVTESLCEKYLLDFQTGERVKRELNNKDTVEFEDILGFRQVLEAPTIVCELLPQIAFIANQIAQKIVQLNRKAPDAVICIGGGSLTPLLTEQLALALNLPTQRVAVRGQEIIKTVFGKLEELTGPEIVTPIGIAMTALQKQSFYYLHVYVNGKQIHLFDVKKARVVDALLAAGFNAKKLYGRPGLAMTVSLNGHLHVIKGTLGSPAKIKVNGQDGTLETLVCQGDRIIVEEAVDGEDASATIADVVGESNCFNVTINGQVYHLNLPVYMDGVQVDQQTIVKDRAQIRTPEELKLIDVLKQSNCLPDDFCSNTYRYVLNGQPYTLSNFNYSFYLNGDEVGLEGGVKKGDRLDILPREVSRPRVRDVLGDALEPERGIRVKLNGKDIFLPSEKGQIFVNGQEVGLDHHLDEETYITFVPGQKKKYIFADLLLLAEIDLAKPQGKVEMFLNGKPAEFTSLIGDGDEAVIRWIEK